MPVPVKYVCPKCKSESKTQNLNCLRCDLEKYMQENQGRKPNNYMNTEK